MKNIFYIILIIVILVGVGWFYKTNVVNDIDVTEVETEEITTSETIGEISEELGFEQFVPGNWQSMEDSKFLMVMQEDGTVENFYNGELIDSGTWITEGYKLKTKIADEEYVYTVVFAGSKRLELTYLPKGNTLNYIRIVK